MEIQKVFILVVLAGIIVSLGSALYHLSAHSADSGKMLRALKIRVALSVGLFILLFVAWALGFIQPHAVPL
ncbi:MAG: hypothetical protein RL026_1541 [Pseudomonadota bacterium]|jgi:uncharacterized membrane protein YidH (DUF202 family)